jgi:hypothetical protein
MFYGMRGTYRKGAPIALIEFPKRLSVRNGQGKHAKVHNTLVWINLRDYEVSFRTPDGEDRIQHVKAATEEEALREIADRNAVPLDLLRTRLLDVRVLER